MALLEAAGTGEGVSLSPDQAGRLRKAVDRVADQARRPAAEAEIGDHLASLQTGDAGMGGVTEGAGAALDRKEFKAFQRDEKAAHVFHGTMESLRFATPDVVQRQVGSRRSRCPSTSRGFTWPDLASDRGAAHGQAVHLDRRLADAHRETPHYKKFRDATDHMVAERSIQRCSVLSG